MRILTKYFFIRQACLLDLSACTLVQAGAVSWKKMTSPWVIYYFNLP